jgi:hypothetical protein
LHLNRHFPEQPPFKRVGLVTEDDTGKVEIALRRCHRAVPGASHQSDGRLARCGAVSKRCVAGVVEGPDVVVDPGRFQRRPEFGGVPPLIYPGARVGLAEDKLGIALERGALIVGGERVGR